LRSSHNVKLSDRQFLDIWDKLPRRTRATEVVESAALGVPSMDRAESRVEDAAQQVQVDRVEQVLTQAIAKFSVQDRVLLGLRFQQELKIAQIAALLGSSSPTLHRRLGKILGDLREALKSAGVNPGDIPGLIGDKAVFFSPLLRKELERFSGSVRLFRREE
jgi:RNA polymerase sigma factor (sigma-70 family)